MDFEVALFGITAVQVILSLVHSFSTRPAREAWFLLALAVSFGYVFPLVEINLMGMYTFSGRLTLLNIPFYLGLGWYSLFYLALCLSETMCSARFFDEHPVKFAAICGSVFGLMEAQWDPTLLATTIMTFELPSFAKYPLNFNPGVPFAHVCFGFMYAYLLTLFRKKEGEWLKMFLWSFLPMYGFVQSCMIWVPVFEPIYARGGELMGSQWLRVTADLIHFSTTFFGVAMMFYFFMRYISRRVLKIETARR